MTGTVETTIDTRRFQAQIPDEELTELRRRIEATRSASQALDGVRVRLRLAGVGCRGCHPALGWPCGAG
jgi:hypothetical protein